MARAPFQVLVIPFKIGSNRKITYGVLQRADGGYWQWIAGGGEDSESPLDAAKREASEEAGISCNCDYIKLQSLTTIPTTGICGYLQWGEDLLVVPEYSFGVEINTEKLFLSQEHTQYEWMEYNDAYNRLYWDSNKNALWELNYRLTKCIETPVLEKTASHCLSNNVDTDIRYWQALDKLIESSNVVIDRPKGSKHPQWPEIVYPLDYGYIENTKACDGNEIDAWVGNIGSKNVTGIVITIDLYKRDTEVKVLLGLTNEEIDSVAEFHNSGPQNAFVIKRNNYL